MPLSPTPPQDSAAFERDGFIIRRRLFDAREVAALDVAVSELGDRPPEVGRQMVYFEDSVTLPGVRVMSRIEKFIEYHPVLAGLVFDPRIVDTAAALLGEPPVLFKEKINFKMPGGAGFKAHQDQQAGWTRYAPMFVTALVSIDAATRANGCLEIAGRWQRQGMIGEEWRPLSDADVAGLDMKPVETAPGDVILFDSFVPHASADNLTDRQRRVLYLTYNRQSDGDHRAAYYRDKHASFPPDIDRVPGKEYVFRV
jgi:2-aminoethylphosphonate dioxygenase